MIVIVGLVGTMILIFCSGMLYNAIINFKMSKEESVKWRKFVEPDE